MHGGMTELSITKRALATIVTPDAPISFRSGQAWFALYVMPQHELRVSADLTGRGFPAFLPMISTQRVRRGRKVKLKRPVFPGYVFTAFDINRDCRAINATDGVEYILENNDVPVSIPIRIIEELQRLDSIGAFDKDKAPKPGEVFRVVDIESPFADLAGKVQSASPKDRIKLLLKIMNREVATEFSLAQLERIT